MARNNSKNLLPNTVLDNFKYEVANELGISNQIQNGKWDNITSYDCGKVGGYIGGSMTKILVKNAEEMLIQLYGQK